MLTPKVQLLKYELHYYMSDYKLESRIIFLAKSQDTSLWQMGPFGCDPFGMTIVSKFNDQRFVSLIISPAQLFLVPLSAILHQTSATSPYTTPPHPP